LRFHDWINQHLALQNIHEAESSSGIETNEVIVLGRIIENIDKIWTIATLEKKEQLSKQLFEKIYTKDTTIIAVEPTPIFWQLLQLGRRNGEDRGRIRSNYAIVLSSRTTTESLQDLIA
jgi:hypothetical protein